jgi:hypothetical protein
MQTQIFNERASSGKKKNYTARQLIPMTPQQKVIVDQIANESGVPISEIFRRGFALWVTQNMGAQHAEKLEP